MKRHCGLAIATFLAAVAAYGCGSDSETAEGGGNQTVSGGAGGAGGAGGIFGIGGASGGAATGSTWAPVPDGSGGAGGTGGAAGMVSPGGQGGIGGGSPAGTGGMGPAGMGGMGPAGTGGMGPAGTGGSISTGSDPTIPAVTGDCPDWEGGSITYMNLGGITVETGPMPSSPTAPMVFYWHGTLSSAGEYALMATAVVQGVKAEGGILVSFNGTTGGDGLSGTAIFGAGDFEIADQMVACAVRDRNVDPHRIFATGCSAGGLFSTAMAANRSSYMAAAAPNSGGLTFPTPFENDHTPPLMTIHGAPGSDVVVIDFSNSSATADMAFKGRGGFVINCNHGGGHCGGGGLAGDIWEFFKAHPYGVEPSPSPWTGGLPSGFNSACEIF